MNFFDGIYTLQEIGLHYNFTDKQIRYLSKLSNKKDIKTISIEFPQLNKFIPYCEVYHKDNKIFYALPAYIYDIYINTGLLPDLNIYDKQPDISKKEYWQYNGIRSFDIRPRDNWEFAKNIYKNIDPENIWNLFLAGSARMDYYQKESIPIEQRIKYAIMEYMLKRPQFFTTDDFVDNPILHKKYSKK